MSNFYLALQDIELISSSGMHVSLILTENSGRIVYRNKINTIFGVDHPGIEIGTDQDGWRWILHHHYLNGKPTIDHELIFADANGIYYDNRDVLYDRLEIVQRALTAWRSRIKYHWLMENCQHLVNRIVKNQHKSEAVEKFSDGVMAAGGITAFMGAITGNKALINSGLAILGTGAAGKMLSR